VTSSAQELLENLVGLAHAASLRIAAKTLQDKKDENPLMQLSARELQILIAIGAGITPTVAAKRLGIATKSFGTYRARVLEKLGVDSNAELAVLAFELNLVPSVLQRLKEKK
jgi:DNA-binding NarL/FixJ family response regulator